MPTLYRAQLTEAEPPMREILDRMSDGVAANARPILDCLRYYTRSDLLIPAEGTPLTEQEELELLPIVNALINAAIASVQMRDGVKVATLKKVAKDPSLVSDGQLPGGVEWELAIDYRRENEKCGAFSLDFFGEGERISGHRYQRPTEANIRRAAEAALARVKGRQTRGRPPNRANEIIALHLGLVFRSSGQPIARGWEYHMRGRNLTTVEAGPFYDFLELTLPVLNRYLREQGCAPVTTETVVRLVTEQFAVAGPRLPNFSH